MHKSYNDSPLISILIPTYNREKYISETLSCAISQSHKNIEIIVVDNASTDKTWELCQKISETDPRIKIYRNKENIGPVNNWKKCISYASGEYAKILWSDDLLDNTYLEKAIRYFDDDVGLVYSSAIISKSFTDTDKIYYRYGNSGHYKSSDFINDLVCRDDMPVSPGCAIFRLKDIEKNLVTDISSPSFKDFINHGAGPDLLIFLLTSLSYKKIGFIDEPLVFFREHENSISISMDCVRLFDRYQQAKLWFSDKYQTSDLTKKIAYNTWVKRVFLTKKIIGMEKIRCLYGIKEDLSYSYFLFLFSKCSYGKIAFKLKKTFGFR